MEPPRKERAARAAPAVLQSAMAGDAGALDALWRDNRDWVAAVLVAYLADRKDLEDLLQDVAVAVVRHIGELQDAAAFRPWLRTIARNAARSAWRRRRVRRGGATPTLVEAELVDPAPAAAQRQAEVCARVDATFESVAALPEELREPLILRAVRGLSQREIAAILAVPVTTVETRLARARRRLRRALRDTEDDPAPHDPVTRVAK